MPKRKSTSNIDNNFSTNGFSDKEYYNEPSTTSVIFIPNDDDSDVEELRDDSIEEQINLIDGTKTSYEIVYENYDALKKN